MTRFLPSFKTSCLIVCILYLLITGSLFFQGLMPAMSKYGVPEAQLQSPHYANAIHWVYSEMTVIAIMIGVMGLTVKEPVAQRWLSRAIFASHIYFTYLDTVASDTPLGNGLYKTPASIIPAIICIFVTLLFLPLSISVNPKSPDSD